MQVKNALRDLDMPSRLRDQVVAELEEQRPEARTLVLFAAEQVAHGLMRHKAKLTVFVPHYSMSGGTLIASATKSGAQRAPGGLSHRTMNITLPVDRRHGRSPDAYTHHPSGVLPVTHYSSLHEHLI